MDIRVSQQGAMTVVSQNASHPTTSEAASRLLFRLAPPAVEGDFAAGECTFI
jgi:hypothetical protein